MEEYSYDGQFIGNTLVVGRTGCGKTTFIKKLARNKLFGGEIMFFGFQKLFHHPKEKTLLKKKLLIKRYIFLNRKI